MEHPHPLPVEQVQVILGQELDRETLVSGWHRRELLRQGLVYYRAYQRRHPENGPKICAGHKLALRRYMHLLTTAYSVQVAGIRLGSMCDGYGLANQCYVGHGGSGWSGSRVLVRLLFRGSQPNDHRPGEVNYVAASPELEWQQSTVLCARRVYAERHPVLAGTAAG